jgi:flagellin
MSQDVTKTDTDRGLYQSEFSTLQSYIKDVAGKEFNGVSLFSDTAKSVTVDMDANQSAGMFSMTQVNMGTGTDYANVEAATVKIGTAADAGSALGTIKTAINQLASDRATIGANISRLNYTSEQLGVLKDNLAAANSRIKDVDVADESTQFARYNILVQAGTAMLAQANASPSSALRLLS